MNTVSTLEHYESLIREGVDFMEDPPALKRYMERWTGDRFLDLMALDDTKAVLEIGVGTGRLAKRVLDSGCHSFTGMDISPKTIEKAKVNLQAYDNVQLMCQDVLDLDLNNQYDVVYSVLTFMHIEDKEKVLKAMLDSLKPNGICLISLDENKSKRLDYGSRQVRLYPTDVSDLVKILEGFGCSHIDVIPLYDQGEKVASLVKAVGQSKRSCYD